MYHSPILGTEFWRHGRANLRMWKPHRKLFLYMQRPTHWRNLESTLLKVKLRKQRRECLWRATLTKSWVGWTIQIHGILETRHGTNHNLCNEDEFVCGLLEWYFIAFIKPLPTQGSTLLEGFWPCSNWKLNYAKVELPSTMPVVDFEDPLISLIMGPRTWSWLPHTPPFRDLNNGDFVLVRFHDPFFGWEEHIVMLLKMIKMNSSKWGGCNGRSHWKKVKFPWMTFVRKLLKKQVKT